MNTPQLLALITTITFFSGLTVIAPSLHAQVPVQLVADMNIDELPNDSQQLKTWTCRKGNQVIAVEVKDINNWQKMIEDESWTCTENLPIIPDNANQFSCEPNNTGLIGIITVSWLEGKEARQQMDSWLNKLTQSENGMICTVDKSNPFWQ